MSEKRCNVFFAANFSELGIEGKTVASAGYN